MQTEELKRGRPGNKARHNHILCYSSYKKFLNRNNHVGKLSSKQSSKVGNTFTPSLHLMPFCQPYRLVLVTCGHKRIVLNMEGCVVNSAKCVVHVAVDRE